MPETVRPTTPEGFWKWRPYTRSTFALGWDVGQRVDPSALAVVERVQWYRVVSMRGTTHEPAECAYHVRHLERLPLDLVYPVQQEHVRRLLAARPELQKADLVVDATGPGLATYQHVLAKGWSRQPIAVTITGGAHESLDRGIYTVPKTNLIGGLQGLMHVGELKVAEELAEAPVLMDELANMEVNYTATGAMQFGARSGKHDDLVLAVALGVWWLKRTVGGELQRVPLKGL